MPKPDEPEPRGRSCAWWYRWGRRAGFWLIGLPGSAALGWLLYSNAHWSVATAVLLLWLRAWRLDLRRSKGILRRLEHQESSPVPERRFYESLADVPEDVREILDEVQRRREMAEKAGRN